MSSAIGQAGEEESELSILSWPGFGIKLPDDIFGTYRQKPGAADSGKIIEKAEKRYLATTIKDSRANWMRSNLPHGNESNFWAFRMDMVRGFTSKAGDGVGPDCVARFYRLLFHEFM